MTTTGEDVTSTVDIWTIIDTYFRDNPYHKTRHQLDSYDELLYSEKNGIKYIFDAIRNLAANHKEHMNIYGEDNENKMHAVSFYCYFYSLQFHYNLNVQLQGPVH